VFEQALKTGPDCSPLQLEDVDEILFTLSDLATDEIVNGREAQDALNVNDVELHPTSGLLKWRIRKEDTTLLHRDDIAAGMFADHLATLTIRHHDVKQRHIQTVLRVFKLAGL
jgi:hypothetical protein